MMERISFAMVSTARLAARNQAAWLALNKQVLPTHSLNYYTRRRLYLEQHKMAGVDPSHIASYEDVLKVLQDPNRKVIIDVRNPDEIYASGMIPSSINIPLGSLHDVLSMSDDDFKRCYQRSKPTSNDELIFYCQSGRRSSEALDKAIKLGYTKSKTYLGSWNEWAAKQTNPYPYEGSK